MAKRVLRRVWTEAEKAAAIALLASNGGNTKRTVREFKTSDGAKVSETTLRRWRDNPSEQPAQELVEAAAVSFDQFPNIVEGTVMRLAVGMHRDEWVNRVLAQKGTAAPITLGVLYDKARLSRGQATEIIDSPFGLLLQEIRDMRVRPLQVIEGGKADSA